MEKTYSYLNRPNMEYVESLWETYRTEPESLSAEWQKFFEGLEFAKHLGSSKSESSTSSTPSEQSLSLGAFQLLQAYRDYGHLKAQIDPLGIKKRNADVLSPERYGLSESDLNSSVDFGGAGSRTLKELIEKLEDNYCGTLTVQVAACEPEVRQWFITEMENSEFNLKPEQQKAILSQVARTESLEKFIHTRYVGTKRFSIEGCDALIPMLEHLSSESIKLGAEEIAIGMAHRGRINVLANFMSKNLENIFAEFDGKMGASEDYDADVKYHLGFVTDKHYDHGTCHVSLAFNPSHLEAVSPVVCGMVRASQRRRQDTELRKKVIPVLIHGDAAVIGQGVVSENFQLSQLPGYSVGGSLHIILNNQIGFTTNPDDARSTVYCSDIAKTIKAPVIIVNADDVEASVRAMDMALRFRQKFGQDIMIELSGYRRYGHNEGDEPAFTQPHMYSVIKKHPTLHAHYSKQLDEKKVISQKEAKEFFDKKLTNLQGILDQVRKNPPENQPNPFVGAWKDYKKGHLSDFDEPVETHVAQTELSKVAQVLTEVPKDGEIHRKIQKLIGQRKSMWDEDRIDWGLGELLAYGSLLQEGTSIRISGQDCIRGTFSHRHSSYFDSRTAEKITPLKNLIKSNNEFCVYNSPLSEMAVLGFEYGNAISDPSFLTIWEAQFGDFANGAQIIIDQFLSSGESKWFQMNGLVLLLPHGYEGQGPEHSSARLERFLTLCAQTNMQVCNPSTPAQFFHMIRRQMKRNFRKPLIVMTPKSLLRHSQVVSKVSDFTEGYFKSVIDDAKQDKAKVQRIVLCSGKIYYDLLKKQEDSEIKTVALVRVEQLYPLAKAVLKDVLKSYPNAGEFVWAQEEPQNMGAYTYIAPKLNDLLTEISDEKEESFELFYAGRTERASPATGSPSVHKQEQEAIVNQCFQS